MGAEPRKVFADASTPCAPLLWIRRGSLSQEGLVSISGHTEVLHFAPFLQRMSLGGNFYKSNWLVVFMQLNQPPRCGTSPQYTLYKDMYTPPHSVSMAMVHLPVGKG